MVQHTIATTIGLHVVIAPLLDSLDLHQNHFHLLQGVYVAITVATSLVVLPTPMHPDVLRDSLGAKLVATEQVRNDLAKLYSSGAILDEQAHRSRLGGARLGRGFRVLRLLNRSRWGVAV